jgi:hypothetical protein
MFDYTKEIELDLLSRAKMRAERQGPYPLRHTNEFWDNRLTTVCGGKTCNCVLTISAESHIIKPLSEFKFKCPTCGEYTYESTITYHLN